MDNQDLEKPGFGKPHLWEYCYCKACESVRYSFEVESTAEGIICKKCGSKDLIPPAWIECPHRKGPVMCVVGGTGLVKEKSGYKCVDRCRFLAVS